MDTVQDHLHLEVELENVFYSESKRKNRKSPPKTCYDFPKIYFEIERHIYFQLIPIIHY